jgi:hypothetical protein
MHFFGRSLLEKVRLHYAFSIASSVLYLSNTLWFSEKWIEDNVVSIHHLEISSFEDVFLTSDLSNIKK